MELAGGLCKGEGAGQRWIWYAILMTCKNTVFVKKISCIIMIRYQNYNSSYCDRSLWYHSKYLVSSRSPKNGLESKAHPKYPE